MQKSSFPESRSAMRTACFMAFTVGSRIGHVSPLVTAMAKKPALMAFRSGSPKEMLLKPRVWFTCRLSRMSRRARIVSTPAMLSALMAMARGSMITSSAGIPISMAFSTMVLAISSRPSAFFGIPRSFMVRPITAALYSLTRGSILSSLSISPFTEFTSAFPL